MVLAIALCGRLVRSERVDGVKHEPLQDTENRPTSRRTDTFKYAVSSDPSMAIAATYRRRNEYRRTVNEQAISLATSSRVVRSRIETAAA